jgi:hypothetical protein
MLRRMRRTVLLGILFASATAVAGPTSSPILGGTQATVGQYPSVVALDLGGALCTGTLIAPEWVLTAAHCLEGASATSVNVLFGTVNINQSQGVARQSVAVYPNPKFSQSSLGKYDIGLVKLAKPVTDVAIIPVNLVSDKAPVGIQVTMVGFGATAAGGGGSVGVEYIVEQTSVACSAFAGSNEDLLCFNQVSGKGKCQGDSGGPSFAMIDGRLTQVGITSFGDQNCQQFGADTRTDAEREFLLQYIPQLECSTDDDCPDDKTCFSKKCIVQPFAPMGLGTACAGNSDCDSGMCATSGDTGYCSATCTVGAADACPAGLDCLDTGGGAGACWPIEEDTGCCDASGAGTSTSLLGFALVGLVLRRKRRRA